jgi:hypothetical protein
MVFSDSRELEKACELALRAEAMERSEEVRDSCSVRLCVRRVSVVGEMEEPVVKAEGLRSSSLSAWWERERRVDCGSGCRFEGGKEAVSGIAGWRGVGSVGCRAGDVASKGEGVLDWSSMCEAWEWEWESSEGVSSPRRSSPSEESSSWSSYAPSYLSSVSILVSPAKRL